MESEIFSEIKETKGIRAENCEEGLLFPKEKWDELLHWQPVSNIPVDEIYKDLPEAKEFHKSYVNMWLKEKSR